MARTPEQNNAIITGSIPRQLLLFFFPIWLGTMFQQLYNTVDTLIVGNFVGTQALAAVGATSSFVQLLVGLFVGLCSGAGVIIAQSFGAGDHDEVNRQVHTALALAIAGGAALTVIGLLISRPVLRLMQTPDEIVGMASEYLQIYFLGMIPQMIYNMGTNILRAVGDSKRPLYFLIVASIVNIVLDIVLVAVIPLGVAGAAIATVLAQGISAVLGVVYILRGYPELRFTPRQLGAATRRAVTSMFWAGLSMGLMSAIYNLGSVALQSSINALGSVYITAQTAARRLAELYFIPGGALGIGVATFSSQNLGAGRRSRIWQSVKAALAIYFVWWVFVMAFTFLLGGAAIRGITGSTDEVIISNALLYLKISAPVIPPMAVLVILRNMLQGIRHTVEPLLASGLELVGKVIFAVWLVPVRGYRAVCFCEPTTWVVCFVFILLAVWRCRGDLCDAEKI